MRITPNPPPSREPDKESIDRAILEYQKSQRNEVTENTPTRKHGVTKAESEQVMRQLSRSEFKIPDPLKNR